jgi:tetratricopeptide (TPR) repeat protein
VTGTRAPTPRRWVLAAVAVAIALRAGMPARAAAREQGARAQGETFITRFTSGVTLPIATEGPILRRLQPNDILRTEISAYFVGRLAEASPGPLPADVVKAREEARLGRYDSLRDLAERGGETALLDRTFLRGIGLYADGQLQPAADSFRAALAVDSAFLPAAFYLGACYAAGGQNREAIGAWQLALLSETGARLVYEALFDANIRVGQHADAEKVLRDARTRWKDEPALAPREAVLSYVVGNPAAALETLNAHIGSNPLDRQALLLAMRILYEANVAGRPLASAPDPPAAITRYAAMYTATLGPERETVTFWVRRLAGRD